MPRSLTLGGHVCYVNGCYTPVGLTVRHKRFGLVQSCQYHDPARFGQARPIVEAPTLASEAAPAEPPAGPLDSVSELELYRQMFRRFLQLGAPPADDSDDADGGQRVPVGPRRPLPRPPAGRMPAPPSDNFGF